MADTQKHAGTLADPIPDGFIYKSPIDNKIHTFVSANYSNGSGGGNVQVEDATDTVKGIAKLSDAVDGTEDASSGVTAATPLAVKTVNDKVAAVEAANTDQDARLTAIETKNTTQDATLDDYKQRIETLEQGGAGGTPVADATDTVKGLTKLSDDVDSDSDAKTGKTAASPKAVKEAMNVAKLALAQAGGTLDPDHPPKIELPGTIIENATDVKIGTVKLSDATNSSADAATGMTAASSKAVMQAMDKAEQALALAQAGGGGQVVEMQDATDSQKGRVTLSDATDSDLDAASGITAATPKAVKAAMDKANEAFVLAGGSSQGTIEGTKIDNATDAKLGVTKLSDDTASNLDAKTGKTAASPKAVMAAYDLANQALKLAQANAGQGQAGGGSIALPDDANATRKGVTKLSDAVNSDSDVDGLTAATPKAVKTALEQAKAYTDAHQGSGGGSNVDATDSVKGVTKLSDAIDSDLDAATGITAATPKAVKTVADRVSLVETKNTEQDKTLEDHTQRIETLEQSGAGGSGAPVLNASDKRKGITKLSDSITSSLDSASGVTAATPLAVKMVNDKVEAQSKRIDAFQATGGTAIVLTPSITSPTNDASNVGSSITIEGSPYQNLLAADRRKHREFQVSTQSNFSSIFWEESVNSDSCSVAKALALNTTYYIRLRDVSEKGHVSQWTPNTRITVGSTPKIKTPTISVFGQSTTDVNLSPTFLISKIAFTSGEATDGDLDSTIWQVLTKDGNVKVWETTDTIDSTTVTVPAEALKVSTTYVIKAAHVSNKYGSSAYGELEFTTAASSEYIQTPILYPYECHPLRVPTTVTLQTKGVNYSNGTNDSFENATWDISALDGEVVHHVTNRGTSYTVPTGTLEEGKDYIVSVYWTCKRLGKSPKAKIKIHTFSKVLDLPKPKLIVLEGDKSAITSKSVFKIEGIPEISFDESLVNLLSSSYMSFSTTWELWKGETKVGYASSFRRRYISTFYGYQLEPNTDYKLKVKYQLYVLKETQESVWTELDFHTAADIELPRMRLKIKDKFQFDKYFSHTDATNYEVYVNDVLREDITKAPTTEFDLAAEGDIVEIKNKLYPSTLPQIRIDKNYTKNLLSIEEPLPQMFTSNRSNTSWSDSDLDFGGVNNLFGDCVNLSSIPDELFRYNPKIRYLSAHGLSSSTRRNMGCFQNCRSLQTIPPGLFKYCEYIQDLGSYPEYNVFDGNDYANRSWDPTNEIGGFGGCFSNCTSLKSIPETLFEHCECLYDFHVEGARPYVNQPIKEHVYPGDNQSSPVVRWAGIYSALPYSQSKSFSKPPITTGLFYNCKSLTSIPKGLFKNIGQGTYSSSSNPSVRFDVTGGRGFYKSERSSSYIGGYGGDAYGMFANCTSLTELPEDLFNFKALTLYCGSTGGTGQSRSYDHGGGVLENCIFSGGDAYGMFYKCTSLKSIPKNFFHTFTSKYGYFNYNSQMGNAAISSSGAIGSKYLDAIALSFILGGYKEWGGNAYGMFAECTSLTTVPEDLFDYVTYYNGEGSLKGKKDINISHSGHVEYTVKALSPSVSGSTPTIVGSKIFYSGQTYGMFYKCKQLNATFRLTDPNINNLYIYNTALDANPIKFIVPKGSRTAELVRNQYAPNIICIEE